MTPGGAEGRAPAPDYGQHFVVTGYIVAGGKTLLLYHKKLRMWLPPGGHMHGSETPDQALLRELREETGLRVEIVSEKRVPDPADGKVAYLHRPRHLQLERVSPEHAHIDLVYFCRVLDGDPAFRPEEHEAMRWFSEGELTAGPLAEEVRQTGLLALRELAGEPALR